MSALRAMLTRPRRLPAIRRPRSIHLVAAALAALLLLGGWMWLRDSSFVKVTRCASRASRAPTPGGCASRSPTPLRT